MKSFLSLLCSVFLLPLVVQSVPVIKRASASDWENRVIYQLLTDRFAKSTDDTNGCNNLSDYCGGTFQGIINHLDYIAGMGFDAIWISPIPKNANGGYHGYWATDFSQINEHFGTADDLKKLVAAAHAKNMYVMLDVVANHAGIPSSGGDYSGYTFGQSSEYHTACDINYNSQTSIEQCWISGLPDINTEDSAIVSKLNSIVSGWVSDYGFDGLRIDTVKHIPLAFLILKMETLKDIDVLVNFIDNHDQPRLLSKADQSLVKNALAYSFMVQGIPVLYYGTEQSFKGGNDPNNREVLWTTGYSTTSDMYKFVTTLVKARKGSNSTVNMGIAQTDNVYVFQRGGSLVVVNNYGQGSTNTITVKAGSFSNGDTLTDVFSNKSVTVQNNQITFQLQNGNPAIFQKK
ncbi:hypothetical protein RO3G_02161 [Rhizopus delemar RA 99-880]|uniref:alpha-amylase n=1 Tax=Rhizopus delemar (strain RA 99-880 / ATCC MYA-4621 / FGSC 9543 / NRRL 43880) TaxID=246409 RepID=I1BMM7_RHIO9|nr:hypothetical protein RO3G_02161 [Rhizopus delemar RA 99-880]|eukprot:EIE77457.1 hypothetical protein RO3G_02161 [Rhizopus delemar RA 99-880]